MKKELRRKLCGIFTYPGIALLCLCLIACGGPEAKISKALDNRAKGLQKMDIGLYMSSISESYVDGGKDYSIMKSRAERLFSGLKRIEFSMSQRSISLTAGQDNAIVTQQCTVVFELSTGDVKSGVGEEKLHLRREGETWKIMSGMIDYLPKAK